MDEELLRAAGMAKVLELYAEQWHQWADGLYLAIAEKDRGAIKEQFQGIRKELVEALTLLDTAKG